MKKIRKVIEELSSYEPDALVGVLDFSYAPYALGDAMTWQENVLITAVENGLDKVHHYIITDPSKPACELQPHININNFAYFMRNLYPAFLCNPLLASINVFQDRFPFNLMLLVKAMKEQPMFPSVMDHFNHNLDYISHKKINAFFEKHGYLPRLRGPIGYERSMDTFLAKYASDRFLVTVNIRLSKLSMLPADTWRDSPPQAWQDFFRAISRKYPDVLFSVLGGFGEWPRSLPGEPNVVVPRLMGYGLAEELTLLFQSNLFMGSSSGFAAAATFSTIPYVISSMEPRFSEFNEIPVGEPRYPFGLDDQWIHWEQESTEWLMEKFEQCYDSIKSRNDAKQIEAPLGVVASG